VNYDSIHPILRGVLGTFEGFRKAGFPSDDIYVEVCRSPDVADDELMVFVTLKSSGKEFSVSIGPWPENTVNVLHDQWLAVCAAIHDIPQADMNRIWYESFPYKDAVGFTFAIMNKGIPIPGAGPLPPGLDDEIEHPVTMPCVFCNGTVTFRALEGSASHTKPTCKRFRRLDPLDFVIAMKARISKQRKETAN
jgi:hypothetical protein